MPTSQYDGVQLGPWVGFSWWHGGPTITTADSEGNIIHHDPQPIVLTTRQQFVKRVAGKIRRFASYLEDRA
jgi:hypothetical protein